MCGIAAYIGDNKKFDSDSFIKYVHKSLGYRGYDSYGYLGATKGETDDIVKVVGSTLASTAYSYDQVIYHNRWATHGKVCLENCHPIMSYDKQINVVHNGIITNADFLKELHKTYGIIYSTETDTEVLANELVFASFKDRPYSDFVYINWTTIFKHIKSLGGDFAFVAKIGTQYICYTRNMPLYISDDGYISSDIATISHFVTKIAKIPSNCLCYFREGGIDCVDDKLSKVELQYDEYELNVEKTEQFDNVMLKEIFEQIEIPQKKTQLAHLGSSILLYGCGSSYYAGMMGKLYLSNLFYSVDVEYASELVDTHHALTMAITQSGETRDVISSAAIFNNRNSKALTNTSNSYISSLVRETINIDVGPEYAVASTKTFLGFCLWFWNQYTQRSLPDYQILLDNLSLSIEKIVKNHALFEVFKEYKDKKFLVLGTDYNYPIALEGALKIKEVSNCWAEGLPAAEIKHGPISLVDENVVAIVLMADKRRDSILSNIEQIKARGGKILRIDYSNDFFFDKREILVPKVHETLNPLLYVVCLQLISYYLALGKGLNPDKPRNLSKAITV